MLEGGRVRWNRVENLVVESSKSAGFDPSQLWMVVDWVLGEPGAGIRKPLAAEVARLIDSAVAGARTCRQHCPLAHVCQHTAAAASRAAVAESQCCNEHLSCLVRAVYI